MDNMDRITLATDARHAILCVNATRRERGPITRSTFYAIWARAYVDVVDRGYDRVNLTGSTPLFWRHP